MPHAQLPKWDDKTPDEKLDALRSMMDDLYAYTMAEARRSYLEILAAARPADDKEAADIAFMRALIQQHPNIMAQNCEVGHLTGSALVIHPPSARILLHYHKTHGGWYQFGGHGDDETDFAKVALREAIEESGLVDLQFFPTGDKPRPIDFDIHTIPAKGKRPKHLHLDWRYVMATRTPDDVSPPTGESQDYQWLSFEAALNHPEVDPGLKRLIAKAQNILRRYIDSRR